MEREVFEGLQNVKIDPNRDRKRREILESVDRNTPFSEKLSAIGSSLIMGILFDYFFMNKIPGISVPIYIVILIAVFILNGKRKIKLQKNIGWFLLIPIILLSICFAIYSNGILAGINILLIPFLMIGASILIFNPELNWSKISFVGKVFERALALALENSLKPFSFLGKEIKMTSYKSMSATKRGIIKGLFISLPLLVVILTLLTSADMIFSYYISNLTSMFKDINIGKIISHGLAILIVFIYLFGYMWSFKYDYFKEQNAKESSRRWESSTLITVIAMLNLVYLIFTIIQFSYLYGGGENSLPQGFTYSEYARKGFFELVAVTVINFAVVLSSMSFIKRENQIATCIVNVLLTVLIIFTFNMLYSAHFKMSLYEGSYGYTYLRVFVHYFMGLLVLLLTAALTGIWKRNFPVAKSMIITALVMYILLNYLNVDGFIARKNIERYKNGASIDIAYLTHLSFDALPYTKELVKDNNEEVATRISRYISAKEKTLEQKRTWSEFNLSMRRAEIEIKKDK